MLLFAVVKALRRALAAARFPTKPLDFWSCVCSALAFSTPWLPVDRSGATVGTNAVDAALAAVVKTEPASSAGGLATAFDSAPSAAVLVTKTGCTTRNLAARGSVLEDHGAILHLRHGAKRGAVAMGAELERRNVRPQKPTHELTCNTSPAKLF